MKSFILIVAMWLCFVPWQPAHADDSDFVKYCTHEDLSEVEKDSILKLFGLLGIEDEITPNNCERAEQVMRKASSITFLRTVGTMSGDEGTVSLEIADISFLAFFPHFKTIGLDRNPVQDISTLAKVTDLERLALNESKVGDLSPLENLSNLKLLYFDDATPTEVGGTIDVSVLRNSANLEELRFRDTEMSGISGLQTLTQIQKLDLRDASNIDMEVIAQLRALTYLDLVGTGIQDINVLSQLKTLKILGLDKGVKDISVLGADVLGNLTMLEVGEVQLDDWSVLRECPNLTFVDASGSNLVDLNPLSGLSHLEKLDLTNTRVADLSPLKDLRNLRELFVAGSDVEESDLAVLAQLTKEHENSNGKLISLMITFD